jgi:hypothetical protein
MTTKAKLLLVGSFIVSAEFILMLKKLIIDGKSTLDFVPLSEWLRVVLVGCVTLFVWILFLKARKENNKP